MLEAQGTRYTYDALGNLATKTTAQGQQWHYAWNAAGHLVEVVRPDGGVVRFAYDALGRRVSKSYRGKVTKWVWDKNKPLHEWTNLEVGSSVSSVTDIITWLFEEESFAPTAKLTQQAAYSVVADHLGTPLELYNEHGAKTWQAQFDSYGAVQNGQGQAQDCPFRYQGQYEDTETGFYYNRFRYYDPQAGTYISQDPAGLLGGLALYAYVLDPSSQIDVFGLSAGCGKAGTRKSNSWNDFQQKTKGQFGSRAESRAEYQRLKSDTSPWPKDHVPKPETMKPGERVRMRWSGKTGQNRVLSFHRHERQPPTGQTSAL